MRKSSRTNSLLLLTLGAAVGVLAGALFADRVGGVDRLLTRRRMADDAGDADDAPEALDEPYGRHDADGGYDDDFEDDAEEYADAFDGDDEEDELSPESIAHMHLPGETDDAAVSRALADDPSPDILELEARVLEAFHNDLVLAERAVDIGAIASGVIELTGWVHSEGEVQHAVTIARGVPDVRHVVNQLTVRAPKRARRATDPRPAAD